MQGHTRLVKLSLVRVFLLQNMSCAFFLKNYLTLCGELVKILTSSEDEKRCLKFKEVIKMVEFLLTMGVIALVFVAATIVVALISGALIKLKESALRRNVEKSSPE